MQDAHGLVGNLILMNNLTHLFEKLMVRIRRMRKEKSLLEDGC